VVLFEVRASVVLYNILRSLVKYGHIKKDSIFLLPLNICPIVPAIFLKAGVKFDFIDISLKTLCIDEGVLLEKINKNKNIKGVLFVKSYGTNYDASNLFIEIKKIDDNIFIIDDSCLKKPDFDYDIEQSQADLIIFSTGYSKYVDIGWGGFGFLKDSYKYDKQHMLFSNSDLMQLTKQMNSSILHGKSFYYVDNNWLGSDTHLYNSFTEYAKYIKNILPKVTKHKELINDIYKKELNYKVQMKEEFSNWRFLIFVNNKEHMLKKIFKAGLFASSHYKDIGAMYGCNYKDKYTNAKYSHSGIINLFNDFRFSKKNAYKISKLINNSC
jgi:dTDP-4-amino-4,6-dideoxygalactose transaminase